MRLDHLVITEAIFDIAYGNKIDLMHPIAQIVIKAKAYVMFRTLAKENLITTDEAKRLLSSVKLTAKNIALLKKTNIDHIKLNFY
jgi:cytochrome b subunit of formate dehydrogenase